jgi:hypothetical protein
MGIYVTIESETDAGVWREYAGKISSALGQAIIEASQTHREWSDEAGRFFISTSSIHRLVPAGEITDPQQIAVLWYKLCRQLEKPRKLIPDANGDLHRHVRCRQARFELAKVIQEALALEAALQAANTTGAAIKVRWG